MPVPSLRSTEPHSTAPTNRISSDAIIEQGLEVLRSEIAALTELADLIDGRFSTAVEALLGCQGNVVISGIGKAGIVGQKLSATLSSTGTPSHFLHPSEAVHGDLGMLRPTDVVIVLSFSGETEEIVRLLPMLVAATSKTIAITGNDSNTLARAVDIVLPIGKPPEACHLGMAPSSSTTAMLALGDALALSASQIRGFTKPQFAAFHPAGNLGKQMLSATEIMRPLEQCRVALESHTIREALVHVSRPGRRTGAIMLTNLAGQLTGIFTDSDLARLLESAEIDQLNQPMNSVMTREFQTACQDDRYPTAVRLLTEHKISELPVVDDDGKPLGIIDITDVVGTETTDDHITEKPGAHETPRILSLVRYQQDSS